MNPNDCGCCGRGEAPRDGIWNDPGLSHIDYRIDRFGGFKQAMRSAIHRESAFGRLTTRDDSDPILAVIDAWATTLDVLTFYQERIANEHYLRTAKEYRSVQEFSRQVGYRLAPGTAATTYIAFKTDDTGYGPESVRVDAGTKIQSQPGQDELPQIYETLETIVARPEYNLLPIKRYRTDALTSGRQSANFSGTGFDVKPGDTLLFIAADTVADPSLGKKALAKITRVVRDDARRVTALEWSPPLPAAVEGGGSLSVFIMRLRVAIFGYNALPYSALPLALTDGDTAKGIPPGPYAGKSGEWADAALTGKEIDLESLYPSIAAGSWVVLQNAATTELFRVEDSREVIADRFMLTAKVTHLTLDRDGLASFSPKDATVLAQSEPLALDAWPSTTPLSGKRLEVAVPVAKPEKGRKLLIVGPQADGTLAGEIVTVAEDQSLAADDEIFIEETLSRPYDRTASRVYANVAYASHGETKRQVLGSGNAAAVFQRFELANAPLTYLAAANETGYESQIEVRVNDVLWHEVPTLWGRGPGERLYTARENERRKTEVGFGNGVTGARTETGVENIAATYRVGAGLAGRVRAGQLNMLLTRPLGVMEATNPLAATGGSDPELREDALIKLPRSALTLGRIVSVQDFADHAARYPGIAKAQSTLLWHGDHQVVFLTVAGPQGETVDPTNLRGNIDTVRDTHFPVEVGVAVGLRFAVSLEVLVRADDRKEKVLEAVRRRLVSAFGFDARQFAEAVTVSEVLAAVQGVEGVEAANVTNLDFATVPALGLHEVLRIERARSEGGHLLPAQILTIDPDRIELKEMKSDV